MSDFLKSLLDKNPGSQTGELIGAYLSGVGKTDNKARNVLIASLFFNAKEAAMQSNVIKQLKNLEEEKTLEIQNATYAFDKGLEKQNQYDAVQKQGINNYYDALAEDAFYNIENHKTQRSFYDNEDKGLSAKEAWKSDWSKNKHKQFLETYDVNAPRLTTIENFNKPINDYFKAKKENIASPQNISLVHNVLGKIGIGNKRDEEVAKVEAGYQGDILSSSSDLVSVVSPLGTNFIPAEIKKDDIIIDNDNVRNLLVDDYGEDITGDIRNEVVRRFNISDIKTYDNYKIISQSVINNKFSLAAENTIKEAIALYRGGQDINITNPEVTDIKEINFIRRQLGVSETTDEILQSSEEFVNLIADVRNLKGNERTEFIAETMPKFVESTVNKLTGINNAQQLVEEYRLKYVIDLTRDITSGNLNTAINGTPITRTFMSTLPSEIKGLITLDTKNFLNDINYDEDKYLKDDSKIAKELKILQEHQFRRNSNNIFESLATYVLNPTKPKPEEDKKELPPGFNTSTGFTGSPTVF